MLIKVTSRHIACGAKGSPGHCPIALAIKEQTDNNGVSVSSEDIILTNGPERYYCKCPRSVSRFVNKFDAKEKHSVVPFNFKLVISKKYH